MPCSHSRPAVSMVAATVRRAAQSRSACYCRTCRSPRCHARRHPSGAPASESVVTVHSFDFCAAEHLITVVWEQQHALAPTVAAPRVERPKATRPWRPCVVGLFLEAAPTLQMQLQGKARDEPRRLREEGIRQCRVCALVQLQLQGPQGGGGGGGRCLIARSRRWCHTMLKSERKRRETKNTKVRWTMMWWGQRSKPCHFNTKPTEATWGTINIRFQQLKD